MNIIVPMAGAGKRLRPHTFNTPKPLLPVAGKPIVQRIVEDFARMYSGAITEVAYIVGDFGAEAERRLCAIAESIGARGKIYYQQEALGTAHAVACAAESIDGEVWIAFADTLFQADFQRPMDTDGLIWVKKVEDPRAYGVVRLNETGHIIEMVEKPETFVSDLAIVGVYYVRDGLALMREINYLMDNNLRSKGEFQLTDALARMLAGGARFQASEIDVWMDCGNIPALLDTNQKILSYYYPENYVAPGAIIENALIIPPCYIGENAKVSESVVGPYVSIGAGAQVIRSVVQNSILRDDALAAGVTATDSVMGERSVYRRAPATLNLGDYSVG